VPVEEATEGEEKVAAQTEDDEELELGEVGIGGAHPRSLIMRVRRRPGPMLPPGCERAEAEEPRMVRTLKGERDGKFLACAAVPRKEQVVTGSQDGTVLVWPLAPDRPRPLALGSHRAGVTCIVASASGELLATASMDATVAVWRNQAGKQAPRILKAHFGPVRACDISRDERLVLSASDDKMVKLSSLPERRFVTSLVGHCNWVRSAVFSPSGSLIASGSDDRTVRLWSPERPEPLRIWCDQQGCVACVRFDPLESAVAACSRDSAINIWDTRSKALRQHYSRAHGGSPISQVAFHPTRELLLSASADRTLRLWDLRAGRLRSTIYGHERPVLSCGWNDDGTHLLSGDSQLIHLWELSGEVEAFNAPEPAATAAAAPTAAVVDSAVPAAAPLLVPPKPAAGVPEEGAIPRQVALHELPPAGMPSGGEVQPPRPLPAAPSGSGSSAGAASAGQAVQAALSPSGSGSSAGVAAAGRAAPSSAVAAPAMGSEQLPEMVARTVERLVTQMDTLTRSLQALEVRFAANEAATAEVAQLLAEQKKAAILL